MTKYDLINKSERIFNIDETGFSPEHTPHKVVGPKDIPLQSVSSARSFTTTLSACASGTGVVVPPYFAFKGTRETPELINGCLPGSACSMMDSGWSISAIFRDYLRATFY